MVPHGFRFNPTDEELIQILNKKASNQEIPTHFIIHTNVYENEPQFLQWNNSEALGNDERYYFCKKENDSREVSGKGWWKATSHVKKIQINNDLFGSKRPLTFHKYKDQHKNRNNFIKTNWIMHEYKLESNHTEWRLCKIKYKGKPSMQEEMENMRRLYSSNNNLEAGSSNSTNTQLDSNDKEQEKQQQEQEQALATIDMAEDYSHWNMQEQFPQTPFYDPNCFHEQLDPNCNDQQFPSLWSW